MLFSPSIPNKSKKASSDTEKRAIGGLASFEEARRREWDGFCHYVQDHGGPLGSWLADHVLRRITVNAPVTLGFALLCIMVYILTLGGNAVTIQRMLAVHRDFDGGSLFQYTSFWTHCFAHSDYQHLKGNLTMLLLVGPSVEFHFRSHNILWIMTVVSLISAMVHIVVGKNNTHQLGASGIVFCFILLNSLVTAKQSELPISFVVTLILYMGDEIVKFLRPTDDVSHHAHLTGGAVGAAAGFYIHSAVQRQNRKNATKSKGGISTLLFGAGQRYGDASRRKKA